MDRDEALTLLKGGPEGVKEWNRCTTIIEKPISLGGVDLHQAHLDGAILVEADLRGADFSGATLIEANLRRANLSGAKIFGADLIETDLRQTCLRGADLTGADLREANLRGVNLRGGDLSRANLRGADLNGADLSGTDLTRARCWLTNFANLDLSYARGLDRIIHGGPSSVSIDTIYRSRGTIPDSFLRGCGIPDLLISALPLRMERVTPTRFHSCFLSYSSINLEFVNRLRFDLLNQGVKCSIDREQIPIGNNTRKSIDELIYSHDKFLLVLSEHSVDSPWVGQEVETALARERREERLVVFPVRIDEFVSRVITGWPAAIYNNRIIGDFTNWQDDFAYADAFERLLKDLKREDGVSETA